MTSFSPSGRFQNLILLAAALLAVAVLAVGVSGGRQLSADEPISVVDSNGVSPTNGSVVTGKLETAPKPNKTANSSKPTEPAKAAPAGGPVIIPEICQNTRIRECTEITRNDNTSEEAEPCIDNRVDCYTGALIESTCPPDVAVDSDQPVAVARVHNSLLLDCDGNVVNLGSGDSWSSSGSQGSYIAETDTGLQLVACASTSLDFPLELNTGAQSSASGYASPSYFDGSLTVTGDEYTVRNNSNGKINIYYSTANSVSPPLRGRLKVSTNAKLLSIGSPGNEYDYYTDPAHQGYGRIKQIMTSDGRLIKNTFDSSAHKNVTMIETFGGPNSTLQQKVEYKYFEDLAPAERSNDIGGIGDLVQVKTSRRASADVGNNPSIVSVTQYRYFRGTNAHKIKFKLNPGDIDRATNSGLPGFDTPEKMLDMNDSQVDAYISKKLTYYSGNQNTNSVTTAWGSEDLQSAYGGSNLDETEGGNRVRTQWMRGGSSSGCSGCGGGGSGGIEKNYYYMHSPVANHIVSVVDTKDSNGQGVSRSIKTLNENGVAIRSASLEGPNASPFQVWCTSTKLDIDQRVIEQRSPAAHKTFASNDSLATFLDPDNDDVDILRDDGGIITVLDRDEHGNVRGRLVKQGRDLLPAYVSATDWTNANDPTGRYRPSAQHTYPDYTTNRDALSRITTSYTHNFWTAADAGVDSNQGVPKSVITTLPIISTEENGSGIATTTGKYYDHLGRMRWSQDGEGYVTYYAHHPVYSSVALTVADADPANLHPAANVSVTAWDGAVIAGAAANAPVRPGSLSSQPAIQLVSYTVYDDDGRATSQVAQDGTTTYTAYNDNQTIRFPNFSSGQSLTPISVSESADDGLSGQTYTIAGNYDGIRIVGGQPVGFTSPPSQSNYLSWTRMFYESEGGHQAKTLTYHDIPDSDDGDIYTNYHVSAQVRDTQGRVTHQIQTVSIDHHQINETVYDWRGRSIESKSGTGDSKLDITASATQGTLDLTGLKTLSTQVYDNGGVGDNRMTSSKRYYGPDPQDYLETKPHYNWRGFLVGNETLNGQVPYGPWIGRNVDWLGRTTATASFEVQPDWESLETETSYVTNEPEDRFNMTQTKYDDLGRVYQTLRFPGSEEVKHFLTNTFYDRNGRAVCTGQPHAAYQETAYDGIGRSYQTRTIADDVESPYDTSTGKFQYRAPEPKPDFAMMSGGNDDVITLSHVQYGTLLDKTDAIANYSVDLNHNDFNGLNLSIGGTVNDGIRSTTFTWYDSAKRPTTLANYGAGDGTAASNTWKHSLYKARADVTKPHWGTPGVIDGSIRIQEYLYNSETGRRDGVTTARGQDGSLDKTTATNIYDDAGRVLFMVENWDSNFSPGTVNVEKNRTVGMSYNGLGQETEKIAYNDGGNQTTLYKYDDPVSAARKTSEIYPDSDDTTSTTTDIDQVKYVYHLDGSLYKMTDQRGVIHTYSYDDRRQQILDSASSDAGTPSEPLGQGVPADVQAIGRSYDLRGRVLKITSYASAIADPSAVENEVQYSYSSAYGKLLSTKQAHSGPVSAGNFETTSYYYDTSSSGGVYSDGLRLYRTNYPEVSSYEIKTFTAGQNKLYDRLNRPRLSRLYGGNHRSGSHWLYYTATTGAGRIMQYHSHSQQYGTGMTHRSYNDSDINNYDALDQFGRKIADRWHFASQPGVYTDHFQYKYDLAGNLTKRNNVKEPSLNRDYDYDELNQLSSSVEPNAGNDNYDRYFERDQVGNLKRIEKGLNDATPDLRVYNDANELTSTTNVTGITHDEPGNMTKVPKPKQISASFTGAYDAWNRLVTLDSEASYRYDGLNRRIVRTETGTPTHFYYNERSQVLTETDGTSATAIYSYWAGYIDAVAVRMTPNDEHLFTHDNQYSVASAINRAGNVVDERYKYSPYGETKVLDVNFALKDPNDPTNSTINNEYTYTGRRLDPGTGLMYFRARYYNAQLGQFISRDPLGYIDGMSQYRGYFVPGRMDPFGLDIVMPSGQGGSGLLPVVPSPEFGEIVPNLPAPFITYPVGGPGDNYGGAGRYIPPSTFELDYIAFANNTHRGSCANKLDTVLMCTKATGQTMAVVGVGGLTIYYTGPTLLSGGRYVLQGGRYVYYGPGTLALANPATQELGRGILEAGMGIDTPAGAGLDDLYRGISSFHQPQLDEALLGIARPRGANDNPVAHHLGNTANSILTSWDTDPHTAIDAALDGGRGVVLRICQGSVDPSRIRILDPEEVVYEPTEVMIHGLVEGAEVLDVGDLIRRFGE